MPTPRHSAPLGWPRQPDCEREEQGSGQAERRVIGDHAVWARHRRTGVRVEREASPRSLARWRRQGERCCGGCIEPVASGTR